MELKVGDKIRINTTCQSTYNRWGVSESMIKMKGSLQIISTIDLGLNLVKLKGSNWKWHPHDMMPILKKPIKRKIKSEYFDLKNLS